MDKPRLEIALVALSVLTACQQQDQAAPGVIYFEPDIESADSGCTSNLCADYGMSCGATLSIRLVDPDTGAPLEREDGSPQTYCQAIEPDDTMCSLRLLDPRPVFFGVPQETFRAEVAIWGQHVVTACPNEPIFDLRGRPRTDIDPEPAFAGSTYVGADRRGEVVVKLACTNPNQLEDASCLTNNPIQIGATVTDLDRQLGVSDPDLAADLDVGASEPRTSPDGAGGLVTSVSPGIDLALTSTSPIARYEGEAQQTFQDIVCATVRDDFAQATTSVSCKVIEPGAREIELEGILLTKSVLDEILLAIGEDTFPDDGLVIGRVVDASGSPLANVTVIPDEGTAIYLDPARTGIRVDHTTANGYFMTTDVPFFRSGQGATRWIAVHEDGRREQGEYRAGLVVGKVTTLVIRMAEPPPASPPP